MIAIAFNFETSKNLAIFLFLLGANVLWAHYCLKHKRRLMLIPPIILQFLLLIVHLRWVGLNYDESEHLHCAWLVSQGLIPFKDFWQHHPPLLWVILAPFMRIFKPGVAVFDISRLFSIGLFVITASLGWAVARKTWGQKAHFPSYLLMVLSASVCGEFAWIRPDLFMTLFLLLGVYFCFEIAQGRLLPIFASGITLGLGASFIFKQYFVLLLPVFLLLVWRRKKGLFAGLAIYGAGLLLGILPLSAYLISQGIVQEFFTWVFISNKERIVMNAMLPLGMAVLSFWGARRIYQVYRKDKNPPALVILAAFLLSTASSFTSSYSPAAYYLQFWFMLCAVLASGAIIADIASTLKGNLRKSITVGAIITLLISQNVLHIMSHSAKDGLLVKHKESVSQLLKYSLGDTCLVLLPLHPIFCKDATRIYSYWQYVFIAKYEDVRLDVLTQDITQAFLMKPPAVILAQLNKRDILLDLYLRGFIAKDDYRPLSSMLEEKYTVKKIGEYNYYIRNDRL